MAKRSTKVKKDPFEVLLNEFRWDVLCNDATSNGTPFDVLTGRYVNDCEELMWYIAHTEKLPDNFPKTLESACRKYYTFEGEQSEDSLLAYKSKIYKMLEIYIASKDFE